MMMPLITTIALVDDHTLFRSGIKELLTKFKDYQVLFEAENGESFCEKIQSGLKPDIALIDMNMPKMDGLSTSKWIQNNFPDIKIMILSMMHDEKTVLKLIKAGAKGYLLKEADPEEFKTALAAIRRNDFYYPNYITQYFLNHITKEPRAQLSDLKNRDIEFLKLAATDLTYKEIADKMNVGVRTIDGYRDQLFEKYGVKSRVALVLYALKNNLIKL